MTPLVIFNIFRWLLVSVLIYACYCYNNGFAETNLFAGGTYLAELLRKIFNIKITIGPGYQALEYGLFITIWLRILYRLGMYFENIWMAVYVFIIERKRIIKIPWYKKVLYCLTWPTFDVIGRYTTYVALFKKVTWKPIPHESKVTIDDIKSRK